jgi:hypothetical protein
MIYETILSKSSLVIAKKAEEIWKYGNGHGSLCTRVSVSFSDVQRKQNA